LIKKLHTVMDRPFGSSSSGMKNTSGPSHYTEPVREKPGPIAADSLAAESVRSGGVFSQNPDSQPLGVMGSHSTFANTDVSSAKELPPAPNAEARLAEEDWSTDFVHISSATQASPVGAEASGSPSRVAPTYIDPVVHNMGSAKPKGKGLTEGGFESDPARNASFMSEIGSADDPGIKSEIKFESEMAETPGAAALPLDRGVAGQPYGELNAKQPA
jgi:hypothetical protein